MVFKEIFSWDRATYTQSWTWTPCPKYKDHRPKPPPHPFSSSYQSGWRSSCICICTLGLSCFYFFANKSLKSLAGTFQEALSSLEAITYRLLPLGNSSPLLLVSVGKSSSSPTRRAALISLLSISNTTTANSGYPETKCSELDKTATGQKNVREMAQAEVKSTDSFSRGSSPDWFLSTHMAVHSCL